MAFTTSTKEVRPQSICNLPKQVSVELDPMDPIAWNLDPSPEDLALLNVVELDQDELSRLVEDEEEKDTRKRPREEDPEERKQVYTRQRRGKILTSVSLEESQDNNSTAAAAIGGTDSTDLMLTNDDRPRISRRRKKKPKGFPKRPLGAYGIFYHQERQRIFETMTEGSLSEDDIQRQVGKLWRALPEGEIKKFEGLAEEDKVRYHEEMAAAQESTDNDSEKASPKNELRGLEEERGYFAYDFPPPPPGVMVIPAHGGSDAGSVAAAAGMKEATPTSSPIPPYTPPRWGYGPPPPLHHPASYRSPIKSAPSPHLVQSSPHPYPHRAPSAEHSYYPPPSPRSWVAPPLPFQHPRAHRGYSPHFGIPARPAPVYACPPRPAHHYSIPPGMELALPDHRGQERKYKVSYTCYRMRAQDVQGFLESMSPHASPPFHQHGPQPPQQPSYGPPRW